MPSGTGRYFDSLNPSAQQSLRARLYEENLTIIAVLRNNYSTH